MESQEVSCRFLSFWCTSIRLLCQHITSVCLCVFVWGCVVCGVCVVPAEVRKRVTDPLGLESQMSVSHHEGARKQTQVLCKTTSTLNWWVNSLTPRVFIRIWQWVWPYSTSTFRSKRNKASLCHDTCGNQIITNKVWHARRPMAWGAWPLPVTPKSERSSHQALLLFRTPYLVGSRVRG